MDGYRAIYNHAEWSEKCFAMLALLPPLGHYSLSGSDFLGALQTLSSMHVTA